MTLPELLEEQRQLDALAAEAQELSARIAALNAEMAAATSLLTAAQAEEASAQSAVDTALGAQADFDAASRELASVRDEQARVAAAIADLDKRIAQLEALNPSPRSLEGRELVRMRRQRADLQQQLAGLDRRQKELDDLLAALAPRFATLAKLQSALEKLRANRVRLESKLQSLQASLTQAIAKRDANASSAAALSQAHAAHLAGLFDQLVPSTPILLLPVRLETRFRSQNTELLVRVYPDDVHQDTHEPELTIQEETWGRDFWTRVFTTGPGARQDRDRDRFAQWQVLAGKYGTARAAWIVSSLQPSNLDRWRANPTLMPAFPAAPGRRTGSWTRAARARGLPDRWLALGFVGGERVVEQWGRVIAEGLHTGPDPAGTPDPSDGVDPGMRWMVDFDAAERTGMGIRIALPARARAGLDLLMVVGVRATRTASESVNDLVELFQAHRFTWTLDLVGQGTPTNNTESGRSGFESRDRDYERTWRTAIAPLVEGSARPNGDSDGAILSRALGLPAGTFESLSHSDLNDQADAALMQHVLWPATWGYYLREGFSGVLRERSIDLDLWRSFFTRYVRAAGPLPPLRIGRQPYGVLPVTSLDSWQPLDPEPEIILLWARTSDRDVQYTIGWDLQADGMLAGGWGPSRPVPQGRAPAQALGAALTRFPDQAFPDLFVASAAANGSTQITIVRSLSSDGRFTGGAGLPQKVPSRAGEVVRGASLCLAPLFAKESRDLMLLRMVATGRTGSELLLTIGRNTNREGEPLDGWTRGVPVPDFPGGQIIDVAIAADDLDGDGLAEIVVAALFDTGRGVDVRMIVGSDAQSPSGPSWSSATTIQFPEVVFAQCRGLDLAFFRTGSTPSPGAVITIVTEDGGGSTAWTWRKSTFSSRNMQRDWQRTAPTFALPPNAVSVAIASWDLGRRTGVAINGSDVSLANLLSNLRTAWRAAIPRLPNYAAAAPGGAADPDDNLLKSLALTPLGESLAVRPSVGPVYVEQLYQLFQTPLPANFLDASRGDLDGVLRSLGLQELLDAPADESIRWNGVRFTPEHIDVSEPWVQDDADPGARLAAPLPGDLNYLQWLAKAPPADIHDQNLPGGIDPSVLFRLLRHALLQEYSDAARQRESGYVFPLPHSREAEIVDPPIVIENTLREARTRTAWRILTDPIAPQRDPAGVILHQELAAGTTALPSLQRSVAALHTLAERPVDTLARLIKETLDLGSHRLDAWITALAARRLFEGRLQSVTTGIHLGGFGWVENLKPRGSLPLSEGFVHAPSLNHAATAAILRAGYQSHQRDGTADQLAIDLSSKRMRAALRLLNGINEGHALGALLGYDFERSLHEAFPGLELDAYIDLFRQKYPLVAGKLTSSLAADANAPAEQLAGRSVVDGMMLVRRYQEGKASGWGQATVDWTVLFDLQAPPPGGFPGRYPLAGATPAEIEYNAVVATIEGLEDAADAIADLLISESVFQQVQGNFLRAGASLDALSRGESPPAEFDVLRTPRSGQAVTHVAAVTIGAGNDVDRSVVKPWLDDDQLAAGSSPRALAEPRLNHWIAQLLPNPTRVVCEITDVGANGAPLKSEPRSIRLADLRVAPLDALSWMSDGGDAGLGELERRVLRADAGVVIEEGGRKTITFARTKRFAASDVSFEEFLELTRAVRALFADARPLQPSDFGDLGAPIADIDVKDLQARAQGAVDGFRAALLALDADVDTLELDAIQSALVTLAGYGVAGAFPISGDSLKASRDQLRSVALRARATDRQLAALIAKAPPVGAPGATLAEHYASLIRTLFGESFVVLPVLTSGARRIERAFATRERAGDASRADLEAWLQRAAQVRRPLHAFENVMLYAEAIGAEDALNLSVAQSTPANATDDVWVGAAGASSNPSRFAGRTSWVIHVASDSDTDALCGVLLDRWVEVVPAAVETTGVAFHCDAPQSVAPQAMLLAVSPNPRQHWNIGTLEAILLETLELSKMRLVDSERRATLGHFLPALLFARNAGDSGRGDTIATNYAAGD